MELTCHFRLMGTKIHNTILWPELSPSETNSSSVDNHSDEAYATSSENKTDLSPKLVEHKDDTITADMTTTNVSATGTVNTTENGDKLSSQMDIVYSNLCTDRSGAALHDVMLAHAYAVCSNLSFGGACQT